MKTIIRYTTALNKAQEEIRHYCGMITQICTANVFIANLPDDFEPEVLQYSQGNASVNADDLSKMCFTAWDVLQQDSDHAGLLNWDDKNYHPPKNSDNDKTLAAEKTERPGTCRYMKGHVAVGILFISGQDEQAMMAGEKVKLISGVMSGLNALASFEPSAGIVFEYGIADMRLNVLPCTKGCADCGHHSGDITAAEPNWRDAALKKMGYSSGLEGVNQFNRALILQKKTQWAFSVFFTKYPQCWFAYAGSGRICMSCDGGDWGDGEIGKILAYEACHLFGAADEYAGSGCTCEGSGELKIPNYNCDNCHANVKKTSCLMKGNDLSRLCAWSRGQLGWTYAEFGKLVLTSYWQEYYKMLLPFEENGRNYLLGHSDVLNRWFISELSTQWDGRSEIKSGNWGRFYEGLVIFRENDKTFLFGHSSRARRWFISDLSVSWDGESEIRNGSWGRFYKTLIPFTENGKTYLLGQSMTGNRWFISELSTAWSGQSEVRGGNWARYYEVLVPFTENGKTYLFGHSSTDNRWFISELSTGWDGQSEINGGNWPQFYPSVTSFEKDGIVFLFAHCPAENKWFISRLSTAWNGQTEMADGNWSRFFATILAFKEKDDVYLLGHSSLEKKCFIAELYTGAGIK